MAAGAETTAPRLPHHSPSCRCFGQLIEAGLGSLRGDREESGRRKVAGQARSGRASRTNPSPSEQPRGGLC